jgi:glycosyltransferase involved in cell wall biosynthesis
MKYSVVFPCKNEAKTIGICIENVHKAFRKLRITDYEIIVVDNNSRDKSSSIAKSSGSKVVKEKKHGYGAALRKGFSEAKGEYVIMCDADNTYDLLELPNLLQYANYDIVIGHRKYLAQGAMSFTHKIGNKMLNGILRNFFNIHIKDSHSGFRIIKKTVIEKMQLQSTGMDLASEMLMQASILKFKIKETPIHYYKRLGESKLQSIPDGWKHLRLMLLYSPNKLYLIPGLSLFILGLALMMAMLLGPLTLFGLEFQIHPIFLGGLMAIIGYQTLMLWLYTRIYLHNMFKDKFVLKILERLTLEHGLSLGVLFIIIGLAANAWLLVQWIRTGYGALDIKTSLIGLIIIVLGMQTFFGSFYLSILGMQNEK